MLPQNFHAMPSTIGGYVLKRIIDNYKIAVEGRCVVLLRDVENKDAIVASIDRAVQALFDLQKIQQIRVQSREDFIGYLAASLSTYLFQKHISFKLLDYSSARINSSHKKAILTVSDAVSVATIQDAILRSMHDEHKDAPNVVKLLSFEGMRSYALLLAAGRSASPR